MTGMPANDQQISPEPTSLNTPPDQGEFVGSVISKKKSRSRIIIATLLTVIITAIVSYALYTNHHDIKISTNSTSQNNSSAAESKLVATSLEHKYRIYQAYIGARGSGSKLTLTDHTGEALNTQSVKIPLHLMAELSDKYFILKEDDRLAPALPNYGGHYWILDNMGKLSPMNQKADEALRLHAGGNNPVGSLYPISEQEILYYQCESSIDDYCGTLHKLNILTGATHTYNAGTGVLMSVSQDGSTAYLFDLQNIKYYSLSNKKITKSVKLPSLSQGVHQIWVSPNGNYLAYADERAQMINIFSMSTKQVIKVQAPKGWQLNSWSGEVTLPVPQWSPDEKNIAFIAWDKTYEYLARIDVSDKTYKLVAKLDKSNDAPENEFGVGRIHHDYSSIGWFNNSILDSSTVVTQDTTGFGAAFTNSSFNLNNELSPFQTNYGSFLYPDYPRVAIH